MTGATNALSSDAIHPLEFRRTLAEFASGVTVIAAVDDGEPVGFACQSFTSVSLDPALVLFCVDRNSRTWPRINTAGRFSVHILGEHQDDLCRRFGSRDGEKFSGLDWQLTPWRTPLIPGALAAIHCEIVDAHDGGDHEIVVGRVLALGRHERLAPLVFFRGQFGLDAVDTTAIDAHLWIDGWG